MIHTTVLTGDNMTKHADGSVTLTPEAAHCVLRYMGCLDSEQKLNIGLNRLEDAKLTELYDELAIAGVGGADLYNTPPYYGPTVEKAA